MNEKLKLYLIKRKEDFLADYDEYNAILVAASDEKIALNTALNIKDFDAKAQFADKEQFNALNCTIKLIFLNGVCRHELCLVDWSTSLTFLNGVCRHEQFFTTKYTALHCLNKLLYCCFCFLRAATA